MKIKEKQVFFEQIQQDCIKRRRRILRKMGSDEILFLSAASLHQFSNDVEYLYRQDSNFFYVTGLDEDKTIAVLAPNYDEGDYLLFCQQSSDIETMWQGKRIGLRNATKKFNADKAYSIESFSACLPHLLNGRKKIYVDLANRPFLNQILNAMTLPQRVSNLPQQIASTDILLNDMRLVKSALEKQLLGMAAEISVNAHLRAWRFCRPGVREYEVSAQLMYEYQKAGVCASYPPIVAGGANGCILHYIKNEDVLRKGDLLLIDAGTEYLMYAGDITRTIPVSGRYSEPQREVYEIVLEAQKAAIRKVKVGNTWNTVESVATRILTKGLLNIGLLRGNLSVLLKRQAYKEFYMHGIGHWLGMDVHDSGAYFVDGKPRRFEAGMTLTVEPGIYLRNAPRLFQNIAIRIEDDVLVTSGEPNVLTKRLPKEVDEIEKVMASDEQAI